MLKNIHTSVAALVFIVAATFIPLSANAGGKDEAALEKSLENYAKTGNVKNCVKLRNIRTSKTIDDYNILFLMNGKKAYLNTLNHRCFRLGTEGRFSYNVSHLRLCDYDVISVFDAHGTNTGGFCGLSKFVEYEKKPKVEAQMSQP